MRILAINASHRGARGYTQVLLDKISKGAGEQGADVETVVLSQLRINRCISCDRCQSAAHYLRCVYDQQDDVRMVFEKIAGADIVIYATPIYVFGMSGLLKTFLDRVYSTADVNDLRLSASGLVFHHINPAICSKPFVTLVCCGNIETEMPGNVLDYFRRFSRFQDAPQVGVLVRNGAELAGHGQDPERERRFPKLVDAHAAFEDAGRELALDGRISRSTARRASQEIVPVPWFALLKRLPFRRLKSKFVEQARQMRLSDQPSKSDDDQKV